MKLMIASLSACLAVALFAPGCGTERGNADPVAEQIVPHLDSLRDNPDQQHMFKVIGECEKIREAQGPEAVANALKQIALRKHDLREQALSLLMRYVSAEEYGDFVKELKTKK